MRVLSPDFRRLILRLEVNFIERKSRVNAGLRTNNNENSSRIYYSNAETDDEKPSKDGTQNFKRFESRL